MDKSVAIFWFRRDLRLKDNTGLFHGLASENRVLPLFIFDTNILDELETEDPRVSYIHDVILGLKSELEAIGSSLLIRCGKPVDIFRELSKDFSISAVYINHDYEPYSMERDGQLALWFHSHGIGFHTFKDQVIFEKDEVVKADGKPYTIFTPYMKAWKRKFHEKNILVRDFKSVAGSFIKTEPFGITTLKEMGFIKTPCLVPEARLDEATILDYAIKRDYPAQDGTTRLSVHLRFGTVSIREIIARVSRQSETFLNELIWREFYMMILWHFPHVVKSAFKPAYDRIVWRNDEKAFDAWCAGKTGFPIVDAGMRQLNATGYMHNRLRMITASFLVKDLLIDWRWGEAYFAKKLMDFELSSNNGGWQWAAGSGCDAAPYFRVFNPGIQAKKFDPQETFINKWIPEFGTSSYPGPIINHKEARQSTLLAYKNALT